MSKSAQVQFNEIFEDLTDEVHEVAERSTREVARDTAKMVRNESPQQSNSPRAGRYKSGWRYKQEDEKAWYVYNQTDWQLVHLLADGHRIFNRFGGSFGSTRANPHVDNAEAFAARELPIRISRGLK